MKDYGLAGKVAPVIAAGRGMGRAISLAFAREGTRMIAAEIDADSGEAGAVHGGTRTAVVAYAPESVPISMVAPGAIDTPMLRENMAPPSVDPARTAPLMSVDGRFGEVGGIAAAVLRLRSGSSTCSFGRVLAVHGGYLSR